MFSFYLNWSCFAFERTTKCGTWSIICRIATFSQFPSVLFYHRYLQCFTMQSDLHSNALLNTVKLQ